MGQLQLGFFAAAALVTFAAAAGVGCTATGSSTTIAGSSGSSGAGSSDPFGNLGNAIDGGTSTDGAASGPVDYEALFGPPASTDATPNSINGIWAGTDNGSTDMRLKISGSSLVIAKRCGSTTVVGVTVASRITSSSVKTLESKSVNSTSGACWFEMRPIESVRCKAITDSDAQYEATSTAGCFFLSGTTLNFYGTLLDGSKLTKLSD